MAASGLLQGGNAVFYHPLDDLVEDTQGQTWTGAAGFTPGRIGSANSAVAADAPSFGAASILNSADNPKPTNVPIAIAVMSPTSVVVIFNENGTGFGKIRAGTISGTTITWGSVTTFQSDAGWAAWYLSIDAMTSTKFVFTFAAINIATVQVGMVSGTVLTLGQPVAIATNVANQKVVSLDATKFVVSYVSTPLTRAKVGQVSGMSISLGAAVAAEGDGSASLHNLIKLDSTHVVVLMEKITVSAKARVGTISGLTSTWGPASVFNVGETDIIGGSVALSPTKVVIMYRDRSDGFKGKLVVGTVSGTAITFGAETLVEAASVSRHGPYGMGKLDASRFVIAYANSSGNSVSRIGTVTGTSIALGSEATPSADLLDANSIGVINDSKFLLAAGVVPNSSAEVFVGTIANEADIAAPTPAAYPTTVGATRIAVCMWANELTTNGTTVTVKRGYDIVMTSSQISIGGTTAVWTGGIPAVMAVMNDSNERFLVLDFQNTGGTNWTLRTSVDGAAFTNQGTQDSGTQAVTTADTAPRLEIDNPNEQAGQWVDELVMWSNNDLFSSSDLDNLFELANTFDEPMNQFQNQFGAPVCWQATARVAGSHWNDSGAGPCPAVIRVPRGATDVVVTDNGARVFPRILEG